MDEAGKNLHVRPAFWDEKASVSQRRCEKRGAGKGESLGGRGRLPSRLKAYLVILTVFSVVNASEVFLLLRAKDLGVFLRLLARSATGQPITTYSSHFHGPRPVVGGNAGRNPGAGVKLLREWRRFRIG